MSKAMTGADAVREAVSTVMRDNSKIVTFGLGVNDPGKVFGTTNGLLEEFGPGRVFETPTSELALTGVGVGLAIAGHPVIHSHQRMDFALLAMDQLVNSAAKWRYMFGDQFTVPYLARMIIGRGWGQGPTHSQNLESWLAHVPGIRVLVPATPQDLYDSIRAIENTVDPIVVIEHRWIHSVAGEVAEKSQGILKLDPKVHSSVAAPEITIVTWGLGTFDCLAAQRKLALYGVGSEVVQLLELSSDSFEKIGQSLSRSGHLLVVSNSWGVASFADSVVAQFATNPQEGTSLKTATVSYPNQPEPTSLNQLAAFHVSDWRIVNSALELLGSSVRTPEEPPVDQPNGYNFGPF
jgi:acetoin:2,6-dichlorophenolindophenol oxidoreductase subunit beta